jgi:hypothetical protein
VEDGVSDSSESPQEIEETSEDASAVEDTSPLTFEEAFESGKRVVQTAKDGVKTARHDILKPAYRLGRRYLRSAQLAAEAFFAGVMDDKKGKK